MHVLKNKKGGGGGYIEECSFVLKTLHGFRYASVATRNSDWSPSVLEVNSKRHHHLTMLNFVLGRAITSPLKTECVLLMTVLFTLTEASCEQTPGVLSSLAGKE